MSFSALAGGPGVGLTPGRASPTRSPEFRRKTVPSCLSGSFRTASDGPSVLGQRCNSPPGTGFADMMPFNLRVQRIWLGQPPKSATPCPSGPPTRNFSRPPRLRGLRPSIPLRYPQAGEGNGRRSWRRGGGLRDERWGGGPSLPTIRRTVISRGRLWPWCPIGPQLSGTVGEPIGTYTTRLDVRHGNAGGTHRDTAMCSVASTPSGAIGGPCCRRRLAYALAQLETSNAIEHELHLGEREAPTSP